MLSFGLCDPEFDRAPIADECLGLVGAEDRRPAARQRRLNELQQVIRRRTIPPDRMHG
jgi:hypothetical protein